VVRPQLDVDEGEQGIHVSRAAFEHLQKLVAGFLIAAFPGTRARAWSRASSATRADADTTRMGRIFLSTATLSLSAGRAFIQGEGRDSGGFAAAAGFPIRLRTKSFVLWLSFKLADGVCQAERGRAKLQFLFQGVYIMGLDLRPSFLMNLRYATSGPESVNTTWQIQPSSPQ
jgi:hypothetical protein